jgi:Ca-activated chloride channel family protein
MRVAHLAACAAALGAVAQGEALASSSSRSAVSASAAPPTEGTLVTRERGGEQVDVPLRHTDVDIAVTGFLADVRVEQTFANPYDRKIDAVYLFPLPTGAAVNDMEIVTGGRTIRGRIDRRAAARRRYEEARGEGQVAALLTQERPNLFSQSVANLEPRAEVRVRIRYVQRLEYEAGGYELVFPMVAGPRHMPPARAGGMAAEGVAPPVLPPGLRSSHDISLAAHIDAGVPVTALSSPSHHIVVDGARVGLAPDDTVPNRDFVLRYQVAGTRPELALVAHRPAGAATGSFFLLAQPPASAAADDITPREMVFVVDTSSSMAGAPLVKAKEVVRRALAAMGPDDTFQIVRFDDRAGALGDRPLANRPRNLELALRWLGGLDAGGGTDMTAGVTAALAFPHDPARLRVVVFLTDGYIGNEDEVLALVGKSLGAARLFSFGVGTAVNRYLLEEMARIGRGAVEVVRPDEDTAAAVEKLHRRIFRPLLTDVRVDWGGLDVVDQVPAAVPDLFLGQPLVVAGRYRRAGAGVVTVHATEAGRPVALRLPVVLPERDEAHPAVGSVWARARIAELTRRQLRGEDAALREEVTSIALEHRLMSPYTAFVAVDSTRVTAGGRGDEVMVPVEVPQGIRHAMTLVGHSVGHAYGVGGGVGYGYGASYGGMVMSARVASAPQIIIAGDAVVRGSRDKTMIKRVFEARHNEVRHCYEAELQTHPALAGRLVLELEIAPGGAVTAARVNESTLGDETVGACLAKAARQWTFPAAVGAGDTLVHYPLVFERSDKAKQKEEEQ